MSTEDEDEEGSGSFDESEDGDEVEDDDGPGARVPPQHQLSSLLQQQQSQLYAQPRRGVPQGTGTFPNVLGPDSAHKGGARPGAQLPAAAPFADSLSKAMADYDGQLSTVCDLEERIIPRCQE